ncbi:MAG TPA: hypothetical protein VMW43_01980 [Bacteroidota bacterium]|nr:hypothetical protein [Bacteroidota bacterium]
MNGKTTLIAGLLAPLLLLSNGCLDEKVKTRIFPDGSAERIIRINDPHPSRPNDFLAGGDSSWQITVNDSDRKADNYGYTARRLFREPADLMRAYDGHAGEGEAGVEVRLQRRFAWFFTYIDYRESYIFHDPYRTAPVSDFLSTDELHRYQQDEKSDSLQLNVDRWKAYTQGEYIYLALAEEIKRRNDPALPPELLALHRQTFINLFTGSLEGSGSVGRKKPGSPDSGTGARKNASARPPTSEEVEMMASKEGADSLTAWLRVILGTDAVLPLRGAIFNILSRTMAIDKKFLHPDTWTYEVEMPGLLLATNAGKVEGNSLTWSFKPDQIRVAPYVMEASSRVTNVWAFIVSGLLAVAVVVLAIRRR